MYPFIQVELDLLNVGAGNADLWTETRKLGIRRKTGLGGHSEPPIVTHSSKRFVSAD